MGERLPAKGPSEHERQQELLRRENKLREEVHHTIPEYEKEPGKIVEKRPELPPTFEAEIWLRQLKEFIVEANLATWAGDGKEVKSETPDYKELEYARGDWSLRDRYTGYFRAPGMTTVRYKRKPAWTMQYGGHGMTEGHEEKARPTYDFLKHALQRITPDLPFRGPKKYGEGNRKYRFKLIHGDITDALWKEEITENGILTFTQTGLAGLVIARDQNRKPLLPWRF